jgi:hypothetical protein
VERNAQTYPADIKKIVDDLPWAEESLSIIKNFSVNEYVVSGFSGISMTESEKSLATRQKFQYNSLISIANHEQRRILQPLIYESLSFELTLDAQKIGEVLPFLPQRVAAFTTACDTENAELKVTMTDGNLYNESDRMNFIGRIAKQYHKLMINSASYMEGEISAIAGWSQAV